MTAIRTELRAYLDRLKRHPGVPIATACSALGFVAGAHGIHWLRLGLIGAAIMSVFWIPVLITARSSKP